MALTYEELYEIQEKSKKKKKKQNDDIAPVHSSTSKLAKPLATKVPTVSSTYDLLKTYSPTPVAPTVTTSKKTDTKKSHFDDGYDFGDITRTILGTPKASTNADSSSFFGTDKEEEKKLTFDEAMRQKYSVMSLAEIEKEYSRIKKEEKEFKEKNGGKFLNYLSKTGSYIGEGMSGQSGSAARAQSQANIDKINDYTREKEIINTYRKKRATEEYLGGLSKEQLQLLDNISKSDDLENAAPIYLATADADTREMQSVMFQKSIEPETKLAEESREKLYKQLKKKNPKKSDDELYELIDNMVELRKSQVNAQNTASMITDIQGNGAASEFDPSIEKKVGFATEHPIASFILSRGASFYGGLTGLYELYNQRNNEYGLDTNAAGFSLTRASQAIDEQVQLDRDWEIKIGNEKVDAFDLFYNVGSSAVDNLSRLAMAGGNTTIAGAMMFPQIATQSIIEGKEKGYSDSKALTLALLNGTFEAISEAMSLDAILGSSGGVLKTLAKSFVAEGSEEVTSNWLNRIAEQVANGKHSDLSKMYEAYKNEGYTDAQAMAEVVLSMVGEDTESFLTGGLAGAIMGGGVATVNAVANAKQKNAPIELTENEQKVVDKVVEDRIAEATEENDGKAISKRKEKEIRQAVIRDLEKGYIDIDTIESVLGGEEYENYKKSKDKSDETIAKGKELIETLEKSIVELQQEYDELNKVSLTEATLGDKNRQTQIEKKQTEIQETIEKNRAILEGLENDTRLSDLKTKLGQNVFETVKDSKLAESYKEIDRHNQVFSADAEQYENEYAKKTVQNAIDFRNNEGYGIDNTNASHDFVDMMTEYATDREIEIVFTTTKGIAELKKNGNKYGIKADPNEINAFVSKEHKKMFLNMDTGKNLYSLVGHEVTHTVVNAKSLGKLNDVVKAFLGEAEYKKIYDKKDETYKRQGLNLTKAEIEEEIVADFCGEKLLTDYDFVMHLATNEQNIFQKAWDSIKYLYKMATAGSKEARQLEKAKRIFEKAYRESAKSKDSDINYSLTGINKDGIEVYETSQDTMNLTWNERKAKYLDVMKNEYQGRTAKFKRNGHIYYAEFDQSSIRKHIYGDDRSSPKGTKALIKAGADGDVFDLVENSTYRRSKPNTKDHTDADYFDYFVKTVQIDGKVFDLVADVEKKYGAEGGYVYTLALTDNKKIKASPSHETSNNVVSVKNEGNTSNNDILPQNSEKSSGKVNYSLSSEQEAYFQDSKVRDENGNLKVMYHGTSKGGHTVFDTYGSNYGLMGTGSYFTDNKSVAESYTNKGKGNNKQVYESYLNITNPLDMDAQGNAEEWAKTFPDVDFPESGTNEQFYRAVEEFYSDQMMPKWEVAEEIRESIQFGMGYDGITHIGGGRFNKNDDTRHQVYIAFEPEQIKNIDNIAPTKDADIRYSLSEDSEGNKLTEKQSEYFANSKAVDRNGNLLKVYHTTKNDFTVFDKSRKGEATEDANTYLGFFFSDDAEYMQNFPEFENGKTESYYLDMKNPIDMTNISREAFMDIVEVMGGDVGDASILYDDELADEQNRAKLRGDNNVSLQLGRLLDELTGEFYYQDFITELKPHYDELMSKGYDGVINYMDELFGVKEYIVLDSNQAKLTSNKNPTADADIRFSLSENVEETRDLMALHNLHSNELMKQLKMGGIAYPSVAVTKPGTLSHEGFGDITLILNKDAIDPKKSKYNKLYSADAYTPTFPSVNYEASRDVAKNIADKVKSLYDAIPEDYKRSLTAFRDYTNIDERLNSARGEEGLIERYLDDYSFKQLYLADKGEVVPTEIKRTETQITEGERENFQYVVDRLGAELLESSKPMDSYTPPLTARLQWLEQYGDTLKNVYADYWAEDGTMTKEEALEIADSQSARFWAREVRNITEYLKTGGITVKEEVDMPTTNALIDKKINKAEYKEWLKNLFSGIEELSGIRNSKDLFTPSGKRRSFSQLHDPVTIDNIIKVMRKSNQKGQGAFGTGNIQGASAQEFGSIAEMKANSDRLGVMDEAEHNEITQQINDRIYEIAERYSNGKDLIDAQTTIVEAVSKYETKEGIARYLKQFDYVYKYTDSIGDDIIELRDYIRSIPTPYFEAKPQRAVSFDEVAAFVIPRDADIKVKQELLNKGYSIAEYDPKIEGDRQRVVNSFEQYKFSLTDASETFGDYGNLKVYAKDIMTPTDIAPVSTVSETEKVEDIAPVKEYEAIEPRPDVLSDEEEQWARNKMARADTEAKPTRRSELHGSIIDRIKTKFTEKGFDFDEVLKSAKNLSTFATVDNTPQRVMEKALGYKQGQALADETVNKVAQNESEGIKWLNSFTDRKNGVLAQISKQYNIKPGSKQSAAAQMYAEGFYVNKNNEIVKYGDRELAIDFPDAKVQANIKGLARDGRIRQIYDETLEAINESRRRNLYPEIQKLDNYFLHFRAMEDTFSRLGLPFNPNDIRAKDLPTDLNGVTADLKPGQPYFASAMHREGMRTSFDLLGGLERYLSSAKNQIYHIDDIQTLRALRNYIADTYGQAKGLDSLDELSDEEAQYRIEQVYNSHLSTFAKFLNEEANVLAGKTTLIDRGLEGIIGRRGITFLNTINKQVGSNMVGYNVSSSLTNFLPVAQTFAKTNKFDFTKAFAQTVSSKIGSIFGKTDSFVENNPTIIRRKGAESFYRTPFQKMGDAGYVLMGAVDNISTELIVRTKYNELIRKGMDEQKASFEADKWVSRLMGDRSLGQQPQLYNSKMLGLVTKFQLEVRNQLDSQFYDTVQEAKVSNEEIENKLLRNAKTAAKVTSTFVQLAVAQHLYGMAFESIAGYNPAFDIIEVLIKALGFDDDEEDEDTILDNLEEGFFALLEDLPYTSTLTGGRIPISSALPVSELIKGEDQYGNEKSRIETLKEAAPYYVLPTGYGQIKKTAKGVAMFSDDHPVAGSYTDSGSLRFPVEDNFKNRIQAAIFGQYANENARTYFDEGYAPLKEKQIKEYSEADMPIADYWEYREGLKNLKKQDEKAAYINGLDITDKQKNVLKSYLYDEEGYKEENPEKYAFLEKEGIGYIGYKEADEDTQSAWSWAFKHQDEYEYYKENGVLPGDYSTYYIPMLDFEDEDNEAYSWAFNNPEKAVFSKAITDNVVDYRKITSGLYAIRADKDKNGKTINGSAKRKKKAYIWGLDIDEGAKYILFKNEYNSVDDYNYEIIDYLNSRDDISYDEMNDICEQIGFKVNRETGRISWD